MCYNSHVLKIVCSRLWKHYPVLFSDCSAQLKSSLHRGTMIEIVKLKWYCVALPQYNNKLEQPNHHGLGDKS